MKKIFLIAGEPSGDALGARLMRALRKKDKSVRVCGVGGDLMEKEGLKPLFDISDLAVMGIAEVVPAIPKVLKHIRDTVSEIARIRPDVVVTIDSWSFSARIHKKLRALKLDIPQAHYVAPQVWAWKKRRAKTIKNYIDRLLTLFPQEAAYFEPHGMATRFVGHSVIESGIVSGDASRFRKKFGVAAGKKVVALLPGSRHNEVSRLLPMFLEAAKRLSADAEKEGGSLYFAVPTVKTVAARVKKLVAASGLPAAVLESEADRFDAFKASSVAIAASGTVALELAIADIPHLVAYKLSAFSEWLLRKLVHIRFVNLSNILLKRPVVPELILEKCTAENIAATAEELLGGGAASGRQLKGFAKVRELLGFGGLSPSERAAAEILELAGERK